MEIEGPGDQQPSGRKGLPSALGWFREQAKRVPGWVLGILKDPAHRKKVLIGAGVLILLLVVRAVFFPSSESGQAKQAAPKAGSAEEVPVKVFKVGRFIFEDSLKVLGTIKGTVEFKLSFEIPGVVSAINYRQGERYEEGALLISLRQDDIVLRLKRSQAEKQKALAALGIAEEKMKEHRKLFEIGAIPKTTLEKVQFEVDQAHYEAEANDLEVKANESMLEKSNLYAPSAGTIGELNIEEGETITQNTLIGSHVSTERVVAQFGVTERDINKVSLGQKAKVYVDPYPNEAFEGTVENIAPVIIGTSRTADVRVRLENPDGKLLPGMFARIKILLYQKKNALLVQTDAVQGKENEQYVFVVNPDTKGVAKVPVVVGYSRIDYSQIDSGLKEGDLAAISGFEKLDEKAKVRILETQEGEL